MLFCSDDDSTMWAHAKHHRNGGKLPDDIPEPVFLADPMHRAQVFGGRLYKLAGMKQNENKVTKVHADRLKKINEAAIKQN